MIRELYLFLYYTSMVLMNMIDFGCFSIFICVLNKHFQKAYKYLKGVIGYIYIYISFSIVTSLRATSFQQLNYQATVGVQGSFIKKLKHGSFTKCRIFNFCHLLVESLLSSANPFSVFTVYFLVNGIHGLQFFHNIVIYVIY